MRCGFWKQNRAVQFSDPAEPDPAGPRRLSSPKTGVPGPAKASPGTKGGRDRIQEGYSSTGFFQKDRMAAPATEPTMMATSHITGLPMTGSTHAPP